MEDKHEGPTHQAWARFRFSVVGPLLSCPPPRGELRSAIEALAEKSWRHPVSGEWTRFAFATIERWLYMAKAAREDPVGVLRRRVRKDLGRSTALSAALRSELLAQYKAHRRWSYKLHADNLAAHVDEDPSLGKKPSYSTVRRFMKAHGLFKCRHHPNASRPGAQRSEAHFDTREVRSYEAPYVGALWHLDFHHASRKIITPGGEWKTPIALGIHDDYSRLCCHLQWYLSEQAEDLVHGLSQAFEKRGLPGKALMDNGAAMIAREVVEGLPRLSIIQETTLIYAPFQNGKEEVFWGQVEGRLLAMLEGVQDLTLSFLNAATQAWFEMEYNRTPNDETNEKPIARFLNGPSVLRPCPPGEVLRNAFRIQERRSQRRSDGTIMIGGVRFEVPARFRNLERLAVQYARWDLRNVHLVDERTGALLSPLYPLDRQANADGRRRVVEPLLPDLPQTLPSPGLPPLLRKLLAEYSATGLPPAYIPKPPQNEKGTSR
jgi:transposase InsO family protein